MEFVGVVEMEMKTLSLICLLVLGTAADAAAQQAIQPQGAPSQEVPTSYRPPKGMCRIWLKDVPPAQQPAPTDCASAVKNVPANGRVVFGDTEENKAKPKDPKAVPGPAKSLTGKGTPPRVIRKPPL